MDPSFPKYMFTSRVLMYNIFTKWNVESNIREITSSIMNFNDKYSSYSEQMIIYLYNANLILERLSQAIKIISDGDSEEFLSNLNIQKIKIPNNPFQTHRFDSYEIDIFGKKFLIKKFSKMHTSSIPTGLSTAYLNISQMFISVGYIAFGKLGDGSKDSLFLSVEESMDDFFETDNFEIFKNNEVQALWFILDFLHILDRLIYFTRLN